MRRWAVCACAVVLSRPSGAQSPEVRVVVRPATLQVGARLRVQPRYASVPHAVRNGTARALRDAGFVVVTTETRQPNEHLLLLTAQCRRTWIWQWRCTAFAARIVDGETAEVVAATTLNPRAHGATRLSAIHASMRAGMVLAAAPRLVLPPDHRRN